MQQNAPILRLQFDESIQGLENRAFELNPATPICLYIMYIWFHIIVAKLRRDHMILRDKNIYYLCSLQKNSLLTSNYHHDQDIKYFHYSPKASSYLFAHSNPGPRQSSICFLILSIHFAFPEFHMNGIIEYVLFCV